MAVPDSSAVRLIVSPHLDDAMLSCGALIAAYPGTQVLTVFAGWPQCADRDAATEWDHSCGFGAGDDVVGTRRAEDERACAALDAQPVWLDFVDDQYGETVAIDEIATELAARGGCARTGRAVRAARAVPPRPRPHAPCVCRALIGRAELTVFAYEDLPYRALEGAVDSTYRGTRRGGLHPRRVDLEADGRDPRKHEAIACYASQRRGLDAAWPGYERVLTREYYWRLGAVIPPDQLAAPPNNVGARSASEQERGVVVEEPGGGRRRGGETLRCVGVVGNRRRGAFAVRVVAARHQEVVAAGVASRCASAARTRTTTRAPGGGSIRSVPS